MKKTLSLLLVLLMVLTMLPLTVFAEDTTVTETLAEGTATLEPNQGYKIEILPPPSSATITVAVTAENEIDWTLMKKDGVDYVEVAGNSFTIEANTGAECYIWSNETEAVTVSYTVTASYAMIASYVLEDGVTQTITIPAGGSANLVIDATASDMTLVVDGGRSYWNWSVQAGMMPAYPGPSGAAEIALPMGDTYTLVVTNNDTEAAAVLDVTASAPAVGTMDAPDTLVIGENDAELKEGSEGYYWTWTATSDGELTIAVSSDAGWVYNVNNETSAQYGDIHLSDDDTAAASETIDVSEGDVIVVFANTYDPEMWWAAPAGKVTVTASFVETYVLEDGVTQTITLPAGGSANLVIDATASDMTLVVDGGRSYWNWSVQAGMMPAYPGPSGAAEIALPMGDIYTLVVTNNDTEAAAVLDATASAPAVGTWDNPDTLVIGENDAELKEGSEGYYWTWTATADGELTIAVFSDAGWVYNVNNETAAQYGDIHLSDDDTAAASETIDVSKGDMIVVFANTYDPEMWWAAPAGKVTVTASFEEASKSVPMYRLYNSWTGEHLYTGAWEEVEFNVSLGWKYEGIAWYAPTQGGVPIYRLYNPWTGEHFYTGSAAERDNLVNYGWKAEGVAFNSPLTGVPVYRLYNPYATDAGSHHYTVNAEERDMLVGYGWKYENVAWNGVK